MSKKILILNAALNGKDGNSVFVANKISKLIKDQKFEIIDYSLKEELEKNSRVVFKQNTKNIIDSADAIVFLTGTYWDSWSSHAQIFFEEMTEKEYNIDERIFSINFSCTISKLITNISNLI